MRKKKEIAPINFSEYFRKSGVSENNKVYWNEMYCYNSNSRWDVQHLEKSASHWYDMRNKVAITVKIWVTLSSVKYLTIEYSTFKKFARVIIPVNWDVPQISKQIYRKLKYREKLFRKFQCLPRFPRKMVFHSATKFGILTL